MEGKDNTHQIPIKIVRKTLTYNKAEFPIRRFGLIEHNFDLIDKRYVRFSPSLAINALFLFFLLFLVLQSSFATHTMLAAGQKIYFYASGDVFKKLDLDYLNFRPPSEMRMFYYNAFSSYIERIYSSKFALSKDEIRFSSAQATDILVKESDFFYASLDEPTGKIIDKVVEKSEELGIFVINFSTKTKNLSQCLFVDIYQQIRKISTGNVI